MPDLSWIDWSATIAYAASLPWGVGLVLAAAPPTRRFVVGLLADKEWHGTIAVLALMTASQMMVAVANHSSDGWFGESAAAWMQALGSLAAIAIVVWLDQRAAGRLKDDRMAEWARLREDRVREGEDRRRARVEAIRECHRALESAAHHVREMHLLEVYGVEMPVEFAERLAASDIALSYYLAQPIDLEMRTLAALTRTQQRMSRAHSDLGGKWMPVVSSGTQATIMLVFRNAAEEIALFLDLEEQDVIDLA